MKSYSEIGSDGGSRVLEQVTVQRKRLEQRLASIRHVVAVASGKGGVGKSTVTACLAAALNREGYKAGVLDADLNGPSMALMMGVQDYIPRPRDGVMPPALSRNRIPVMSMDLFLPPGSTPVLWDAPSQQGAYTWRSIVEMSALRELLADTDWGPLDVLLVDLAPGSDKLQNLADLLTTISGTVVVTTPTVVAQMVVGRSITMASEVAKVPVIGLVENMSGNTCSRCGYEEGLFAGSPSARKLAKRHEIMFLGSIPFDARLARSLDEGATFLESYPDSTAARAVFSIANKLKSWLDR